MAKCIYQLLLRGHLALTFIFEHGESIPLWDKTRSFWDIKKIHFPMSEGVSKVSKRVNKWAQRRARAKWAVWSKWTSERCERTSKRTSEWPSNYVSILVCSRPQCTPWYRLTKNPDVSSGSLVCSFARLLALLTSLAHNSTRLLTYSLTSSWESSYFCSVFFSVLDHSVKPFFASIFFSSFFFQYLSLVSLLFCIYSQLCIFSSFSFYTYL